MKKKIYKALDPKYCILCSNKTRYVSCMWRGLFENLFSPQICIEGQLRAGIWLAPGGGSCRLRPQEAQDSNRACQVLRERGARMEKNIYAQSREYEFTSSVFPNLPEVLVTSIKNIWTRP